MVRHNKTQGVRGKLLTDDARLPVHSIESLYCGRIRPRSRVTWVLFGVHARRLHLDLFMPLSLSLTQLLHGFRRAPQTMARSRTSWMRPL